MKAISRPLRQRPVGKVLQALAVLLIVPGMAGCGPEPDGWTNYSSPDATYSAAFPLKPNVRSDTTEGEVRHVIFGSETLSPKHMVFEVQEIESADATEIPTGSTSCLPSMIATMEQNIGNVRGVAPEYKRTIPSAKDLYVRETLTKHGGLWLRQRYFCNGKRLYVAQTLSAFRSEDPDADRFLDSFRID